MTATATGSPGLITDFETGASAPIAETDGRVGGFGVYQDAMSTITPTGYAPEPTAAAGSGASYGLHVSGTVSSWASVQVDLAAKGACYDASAYANGIKFWAKGTGTVSLAVMTAVVAAKPDGQRNWHNASVTLSAEGGEQTIPWASLTQPDWGMGTEAFDSSQIIGLSFNLAVGEADFTVDDVAFY